MTIRFMSVGIAVVISSILVIWVFAELQRQVIRRREHLNRARRAKPE